MAQVTQSTDAAKQATARFVHTFAVVLHAAVCAERETPESVVTYDLWADVADLDRLGDRYSRVRASADAQIVDAMNSALDHVRAKYTDFAGRNGLDLTDAERQSLTDWIVGKKIRAETRTRTGERPCIQRADLDDDKLGRFPLTSPLAEDIADALQGAGPDDDSEVVP